MNPEKKKLLDELKRIKEEEEIEELKLKVKAKMADKTISGKISKWINERF